MCTHVCNVYICDTYNMMYYYHRKIPAHSTSIGIVNLHMFYRARRYFMKYDYSSYATCSATCTCMITKFYFFLF